MTMRWTPRPRSISICRSMMVVPSISSKATGESKSGLSPAARMTAWVTFGSEAMLILLRLVLEDDLVVRVHRHPLFGRGRRHVVSVQDGQHLVPPRRRRKRVPLKHHLFHAVVHMRREQAIEIRVRIRVAAFERRGPAAVGRCDSLLPAHQPAGGEQL